MLKTASDRSFRLFFAVCGRWALLWMERCHLRLSSRPVAPVAALTAVAPMMAAAAPEATEPSFSKPETEQDTEGKHGTDETPEALETEREAKRPRHEMTQAEVEAEGMSDHDVTMQVLRLCQSSLEYTARQAQALKAVQEQLGETASLAYHSESCQRYALAAISQSAGHIKGMAWQLSGSRHEEKVSCKSLLVSNTGKMGTSLTKLSEHLEKQGIQNTERDKQFSDVLLAIQGQIADGYARGSVPAGTPITPTTSAAPVGATSVFPPPAPVMPGSPAGIGGYGGPVSGSCGAPAPPPPMSPAPAPAPVRSPIMLQLRQPDGSILQRQASPTRYLDDSLRSNSGFVWCDDHSSSDLKGVLREQAQFLSGRCRSVELCYVEWSQFALGCDQLPFVGMRCF
eukprot:s3384_g8.t1